MSTSLLPERHINLSPSLAATIGLEEACLMSVLGELLQHHPSQVDRGHRWLQVNAQTLERLCPFWQAQDIQRISWSLRDKGIILLNSAPFCQSLQLIFAFNENAAQAQAQAHQPRHQSHQVQQSHPRQAPQARANLIPPNWQPGRDVMQQLAQHGIPSQFSLDQLPEFITYWQERRESQHSWGSKFIKHVIRQWREQESSNYRRDQEAAMDSHWQPNEDAMEILVRGGINRQFCLDAIPEFVLYWSERGDKSRTWNSRFIQHVNRQWAQYTNTLENDSQPRKINPDWQPSQDVYDVLSLANIELAFAQKLVPEFILFWRDSNQLHRSWNTKFIQHVKYHWAKQHQMPTAQTGTDHARQQSTTQSGRTRDRSLEEQLSDKSWAY